MPRSYHLHLATALMIASVVVCPAAAAEVGDFFTVNPGTANLNMAGCTAACYITHPYGAYPAWISNAGDNHQAHLALGSSTALLGGWYNGTMWNWISKPVNGTAFWRGGSSGGEQLSANIYKNWLSGDPNGGGPTIVMDGNGDWRDRTLIEIGWTLCLCRFWRTPSQSEVLSSTCSLSPDMTRASGTVEISLSVSSSPSARPTKSSSENHSLSASRSASLTQSSHNSASVTYHTTSCTRSRLLTTSSSRTITRTRTSTSIDTVSLSESIEGPAVTPLGELSTATLTTTSVAAVLLAAVGSPASASSLAQLSLLSCAAGQQSSPDIGPSAYLISPFYHISNVAIALGNIGLTVAILVVHFGCVVAAMRWKQYTFAVASSLVRFPSLPLAVFFLLAPGSLLGTVRLLVVPDGPTVSDIVLACIAIACVIGGIAAGQVLLRVFVLPATVMHRYVSLPPCLHHVLQKCLLPMVQWVPQSLRLSHGILFVAYKPQFTLFAVVEVNVALCVSLVAGMGGTGSQSDKGSASCGAAAAVVGTAFAAYAASVVLCRPYRLPLRNVFAAVDAILFSAICFLTYEDHHDNEPIDTLQLVTAVLQVVNVLYTGMITHFETSWATTTSCSRSASSSSSAVTAEGLDCAYLSEEGEGVTPIDDAPLWFPLLQDTEYEGDDVMMQDKVGMDNLQLAAMVAEEVPSYLPPCNPALHRSDFSAVEDTDLILAYRRCDNRRR